MDNVLPGIRLTPRVRRAAVVEISAEILLAFFTGDREHHYIVRGGLPEDARVLGVTYDAERDCWRVAFESETLSEVAEGAMLPTIYPPSVTDVTRG